MRKDSDLAAFSSIKPELLQGIPLLCSKQAVTQNELSGWFGGDFEKLNIIVTYNLINNAALMVEEGVGYAMCLDKLVNTTGDSNLCFRQLEPHLEAHLYLVWKKHHMFSKAAGKFLSMFQKENISDP
jgi:DNA-binding transcriptional LysR family regulator